MIAIAWNLRKKYIDAEDYDKALVQLTATEGDSNQKRVLTVAASLGQVDFSIWQIILSILDANTGDGKLNFDTIFNSVSASVFGEAGKTEKVAVMRSSIDILLNAPDPTDADVANLNCFLGGLLSVVVVEDGSVAITALKDSLTRVQNASSGFG